MLDADQKTEFDQRGYVHLPGAFPRERADAMADRVWTHLEEHRGIRRDDPQTWGIDAPWVGLKTLKEEPLFQSVGSPELCAAIDDVLGAGEWRRPRSWGGFLATFPSCRPTEWSVPGEGWHVDFHFTHEPGSHFGLSVFAFLSKVGPLGGGTLVVRGSHRLVERYVDRMPPEERQQAYPVLRDRFNTSDPWLTELTTSAAHDPSRVRRFMRQSHRINGVSVGVEQLTGCPGDVFLVHPWMLHARCPNAGDGPRFMLVKNIYSESSRSQGCASDAGGVRTHP